MPRAVQVIQQGADPVGARWTPDELPRLSPSRPAHDGMDPVADARLAAAIDEAYTRGFEAGRHAVEESSGVRLRGAIQSLEHAAGLVAQDAERWVGNAEENICALAVLVARHILDRELSTDRSKVLDAVRLVLAEFPVTESVRIRLNPADLQAVTMALSGDGQSLGRSGAIRWTADPSIVSGGCLIEGHERIVDGRVDAALERCYRRLSHAGT
jgi:flagellar biosynthesis/type III secretory pathway protein FliH